VLLSLPFLHLTDIRLPAIDVRFRIKQTLGEWFCTSEFNPKRTSALLAKCSQRWTFNHPPTQEILSLLLAVKPRPQAQV
jgi:hypothetical protein